MHRLINDTRNLNIRYDLPEEILEKLLDVYKSMEGWLGFGDGNIGMKGIPYWISFDESNTSISASIEPSGLQLSATNIDADEWNFWIFRFKRKATEILLFKVGEIELGEVGHEIEWMT